MLNLICCVELVRGNFANSICCINLKLISIPSPTLQVDRIDNDFLIYVPNNNLHHHYIIYLMFIAKFVFHIVKRKATLKLNRYSAFFLSINLKKIIATIKNTWGLINIWKCQGLFSCTNSAIIIIWIFLEE